MRFKVSPSIATGEYCKARAQAPLTDLLKRTRTGVPQALLTDLLKRTRTGVLTVTDKYQSAIFDSSIQCHIYILLHVVVVYAIV